MSELKAIARIFSPQTRITKIQEYGSGNINQTFLVTTDSPIQPRYILQKINSQVFSEPELVMDNICLLINHIQEKLAPDSCWKIPTVLLQENQKPYYQDEQGYVWRGMSFIENSLCLQQVENSAHAQEIGYGLGMFHNLISDLAVENLSDTLPGFHITPGYLKYYQQISQTVPIKSLSEIEYAINFIEPP